MYRVNGMMLATSAAALLAFAAAPALAEGKGDRAQQAIAAATGKIDAARKSGTTGDAPNLTARAEAALRMAQEDVSAGHKEQAIVDANRASELADMAIGHTNNARDAANAAQAADAAAAVNAAQQNAAAANQAAAQTAADANARADAANMRATNAEQAAATANAEADAIRAQPAPTTTVTTTTEKNVHTTAAHPVRRVVRTTSRPATTSSEQTTTTVQTTPQ